MFGNAINDLPLRDSTKGFNNLPNVFVQIDILC